MISCCPFLELALRRRIGFVLVKMDDGGVIY